MRLLSKKDGFTLIELLIVILTGTIVTAAATTTLLLAMRINRKSLDTVERQSIMRIMQSVFEDMGSDENYTFDDEEDAITDSADNLVISRVGDKLVAGGNAKAVLMDDVESFSLHEPIIKPFNYVTGLYTFAIEAQDGQYTSSVYGRAQDDNWFADDPSVKNETGRNLLVDIAASQIGSVGQIQNYKNDKDGPHFNLWYIGRTTAQGYGETGWSENTPWCSVFASWVIDKTYNQPGTKLDSNSVLMSYLENAPKEANVNHMWLQFFVNAKNMHNLKSYGESLTNPPQPGDLIFFVDKGETTENDLFNLRNLNALEAASKDLEEFIDELKAKMEYENEGWYVHTSDATKLPIAYSAWDPKNPTDGYEKWTVVKNYLGCAEDGIDHIGIVVEVTDTHVYTIEGNVETKKSNETSTHSVMLRKHPLNNEKNTGEYHIFGYATLDWNINYK